MGPPEVASRPTLSHKRININSGRTDGLKIAIET
jgi:hypothetical protein